MTVTPAQEESSARTAPASWTVRSGSFSHSSTLGFARTTFLRRNVPLRTPASAGEPVWSARVTKERDAVTPPAM